MLIEIPDSSVIFSVLAAFVVGLFVIFVYNKVKPLLKAKTELLHPSQTERLEYYERQLIDMKIRLDSLELEGLEPKKESEGNQELKDLLVSLVKKETEPQTKQIVVEEPKQPKIEENLPKIDHNNPIEHVLHLITTKPMTSRDIQITLKRSREHTSRLMKKLYEDGLVKRNTDAKPYTYSITDKGKEKVGLVSTASPMVQTQ